MALSLKCTAACVTVFRELKRACREAPACRACQNVQLTDFGHATVDYASQG